MATIYPSSNLSNKEVFAINGQLPPERIEELIAKEEYAERAQNVEWEIDKAQQMLRTCRQEIYDMQEHVRGGNKERIAEIEKYCSSALKYLDEAMRAMK